MKTLRRVLMGILSVVLSALFVGATISLVFFGGIILSVLWIIVLVTVVSCGVYTAITEPPKKPEK